MENLDADVGVYRVITSLIILKKRLITPAKTNKPTNECLKRTNVIKAPQFSEHVDRRLNFQEFGINS